MALLITLGTAEQIVANPTGYKAHIVAQARETVAHWKRIRAKQARLKADAQKAAATRDVAADLALFLLEKTGTVLGTWEGRMTATEQRALIGRYLGKGVIVINGDDETVRMRVKVCFGLDTDDVAITSFRTLCCGTL